MTRTATPHARSSAALAAVLVAAAGAYIALVHAAHGNGPGFVAEWLSIVLLGTAPALVLGAAVAAERTAEDRLERAAVAARVALAAGVAAAIGATATRVLDTGAPAALDVIADLALALAVTAPVATALAFSRMRGAVGPVRADGASLETVATPPPAPRALVPTTRRGFLQLGAGGVTTAAIGGMAARGVLPAVAGANTLTFAFTVTDGWRPLVDLTEGFFRGFKLTGASGGPAYPGPPIGNTGPGASAQEVFEGDVVRLLITNDTPREHTFLIERTASESPASPVVGPAKLPPGQVTELVFDAPQAGTYVYRDANVNNRLLGMHGVMVVQPQNARANVPYSPGGDRLTLPIEVQKQHTWVLQHYDQMLGEAAAAAPNAAVIDYPLEQIVPRFFFINGMTGDDASFDDEHTVPVVPLQIPGAQANGVLLRVVNTGVATHSPHWHGNHVFIVQRNGVPERAGYVEERDVVRMEPLYCYDVILPAHTGYDTFPPVEGDPDHPALHHEKHPGVQVFPMHCHAEMSQSAAGGMYPLGMLTDWHLGEHEEAAAESARSLAANRAQTRSQPQSLSQRIAARAERRAAKAGGPGPGGRGLQSHYRKGR